VEDQLRVERVMARYLHVYQSLYQRSPKELRDLGNNWVLVNGARMSVEELENLANELNSEYQQSLANKRSVVKRLLNWFKN
jgi:hypothetical protein